MRFTSPVMPGKTAKHFTSGEGHGCADAFTPVSKKNTEKYMIILFGILQTNKAIEILCKKQLLFYFLPTTISTISSGDKYRLASRISSSAEIVRMV